MKLLRFFCLCLVLSLFLLSAVACAQNEQTNDKKPVLSSLPQTSSTDDSSDEQTSSSTDRDRYTSELCARYYAGEEGGYSLWSISAMNDGDKNICVDSEGYIVFEYSADATNVTNVYNNAFVIKEFVREDLSGHYVYKLMQASTGKVLYTADTKKGEQIIDLEYSAADVFKDGYCLVVNTEESYSGVTYKFGVLGANGEWIVPLSEKNPVVTTLKSEAELSAFEKMYYMGEDILYFAAHGNHYFYNIKSNKVIKVSSEISESNTKSVLTCGGPFKNGAFAEAYGFGGGLCKVTSAGKITIIPYKFNEKLDEKIGVFYYDSKNNKAIRMGYTYHQSGFSLFDSDGKIIKTLKDSEPHEVNGFTDEGIAQLVLINKEGTKYYTVINTKGEFMFEPIKMDTAYVYDVSGLSISNGENYANKTDAMVVDRSGKILYRSTAKGDFGYRNGIVKDEGAEKEYIEILK